MSNVDERALQVVNTWINRDYVNDSQKTAQLQVLIIEALKKQDKITKVECIKKIAFVDDNPEHDVVLGNAIRECLKANTL